VRLAEPFTFFVDRSLGGAFVAAALREAGHPIVVHDDEFEPDARDVDWLRSVGGRSWVVLTKDARIRTSALERGALPSSNVAAFIRDSSTSNEEVLRRWDLPIVATVTALAGVSVLYANGERLHPARFVK
jgi:hypothetical protein